MTAILPANWVRLYSRETAGDEDLFELAPEQQVSDQQLATWERPSIIGSSQANPEEIISGWSQDDWSGGFGIEDADEGVDTARFRFGLIDGRSPHQMCLTPMTYTPAPPSWASGASLPLGKVGTQFYVAWGEHAAGHDYENDVFHTTDNDLNMTPLTEGTRFAGYLFVPCGASGAVALEELTANTGTLTITTIPNTTLTPILFGTWDNKLYALTTDHKLYSLTVLDALDDPTDPANWVIVDDIAADPLVLDTSQEPHKLLNYKNRAGEIVLWLVCSDGAFLFDPDTPAWMQASLETSVHPEFGADAVVWRAGEDLWIAAGGADFLRYTSADVTVPLSGPSKDSGIPPAYSGSVVSMVGERSTLYFLVKGRPLPYTPEWVEDDPGSPGFAQSSMPIWLGGYTGTAYFCLSEDPDTTAEPTWLSLSMVREPSGYRLWWGSTNGTVYNQIIPYDFSNPRARIAQGQHEFREDGWYESIRYDANMVGWDKLASHAFMMMDYASDESYVDIFYRTDADLYALSGTNTLNEPSYHPWMRVTARGRTLLWFDNAEIDPKSGEPWREGLNNQWVQFRYEWHRGPNTRVTPIQSGWSLHHVRLPQDASSLTLSLNVPDAEIVNFTTPSASARRLKAMQRLGAFVHLQLDNETFKRGKLAGVTETRWAGGNQRGGKIDLIFVEIGASQNAHQSLGTPLEAA